jgi:hypothetical protein
MRFATASAAGALLLLSTSPAFCWGSITRSATTLGMNFNTHGCIDETAYAMLNGRPELPGTDFPKIEAINGFEGVDSSLHGNGPDAKNATLFSAHYYNPALYHGEGDGRAPVSVGEWFEKLARGEEKPKAAAWSAHFLADLSVPFHVNGMSGSQVQKGYPRGSSPSYILSDEATGPREHLSYVFDDSLPHNSNFAAEAGLYLAAAKTDPKLDWFDPWYWNGGSLAPNVASSHLVWEGKIKTCPSRESDFSTEWPGNPVPSWHQNVTKMHDVVVAFAINIAKNTRGHIADFLKTPDLGEIQAEESIATMWRASFSGLRVGLTYQLDPASLTGKTGPVLNVYGKIQNSTNEMAEGVQLQLVVTSGPCAIIGGEGEAIKIVGDVPFGGPRQLGEWRVSIPHSDSCSFMIGAIGKYNKTPDLQIAYRPVVAAITIPEVKEDKPKPPAPVHDNPGNCLDGVPPPGMTQCP